MCLVMAVNIGGAGARANVESRYKLAEKVADRLNDLNKDLSDVIEEINGVSSTISKTSNPDDPVSHVLVVCTSAVAPFADDILSL